MAVNSPLSPAASFRLHPKFIASAYSLHRTVPFSPPIAPILKSSSALFLQAATVLLGLAVLAFLLGEPHLEGRNAHATIFEIYFHDPFLAYVYVGSVPFFVALYRTFGLFGHVRQTGSFSQASVEALRAIKRCAFTLLGFVAGGILIILIFGDQEDRPPGIFMGMLVTLATSGVATAAAVFARKLQNSLGRAEDHRG